jgi:hypothetical protein
VFSLFLRVILPCWYLILCFYERPLLSTVFGRLFQGGARLEILSAQQGLNKFALKSKLYINAMRQAFDELQQLKSATA